MIHDHIGIFFECVHFILSSMFWLEISPTGRTRIDKLTKQKKRNETKRNKKKIANEIYCSNAIKYLLDDDVSFGLATRFSLPLLLPILCVSRDFRVWLLSATTYQTYTL